MHILENQFVICKESHGVSSLGTSKENITNILNTEILYKEYHKLHLICNSGRSEGMIVWAVVAL